MVAPALANIGNLAALNSHAQRVDYRYAQHAAKDALLGVEAFGLDDALG